MITLASLIEIYQQQKTKGYPFLLTSRLNQNILESLISVIRQRGDYARNPTARNFQAAFTVKCINNLLKSSKYSSYVADVESTMLLYTSRGCVIFKYQI